MTAAMRLPTGSRCMWKLWPRVARPVGVGGLRDGQGTGRRPNRHLHRPLADLQGQQARSGSVLAGVGHQLAHHQLDRAGRAAGDLLAGTMGAAEM